MNAAWSLNGHDGQGEEVDDIDVLVVTTMDGATHRVYERAAAWLRTSTPALLRHVLAGTAPTLDEATGLAEQEMGRTVPVSLQLYTALVRGDMRVGGEARCELSPQALQRHEHVMRNLVRARELIERAAVTVAAAQAACAQAQSVCAGRAAAR